MFSFHRLMTGVALAVSLCLMSVAARAQSPDTRMQWWSDARFGMFIHWGLYSEDGCFYQGRDGKSEHMMLNLKIPLADYAKLANDFNPVRFNADEWVSVAKEAGMKYMVITSKHHDGFAMFRSPSNDYNVVARTPWKRDPIKELSEACRKQGLKFGVYYSLGRDWADPDVPTRNGYRSNTWDYPDESKKVFARYFERKVIPQVTELLTQYGPIAVLWFDTPEEISPAESKQLVALIHRLQPECIINSRVGNGLGDYGVQEQKILGTASVKPWETCMTLNRHWGYYKGDENWKPAATVIRNLIDIASKGGNYLLNVGPTGAGVIPEGAVSDLREVGIWMKKNGSAIYGTGASPLPHLSFDGRCTAKGDTLYLHVFTWPDAGLTIDGLQTPVADATVLATGRKLTVSKDARGKLTIAHPDTLDPAATVIALHLTGAPKAR